MASLLDLPVQTVAESLADTKTRLTDAYDGVETEDGRALDARHNDSLLFPLSEVLAQVSVFLQILGREYASQATPMGATGANLDLYLELKGVPVPTAQYAQVDIDVTATAAATLDAGWDVANFGGERYTTDAPLVFAGPGTATVTMTAEAIGSASNVALGDTVLLEPKTGIVSEAVVSAIVVIGADPADDAAKSELLAASFAGDAGVGTEAWYVQQLRAIDGAIDHVFSAPAAYGNGSLVLWPLLALSPLTLPSAGQTSSWEAKLRERRTVNDRIFVALLATPTIDIDATIVPDTPDTRAAVVASVDARFAESYDAASYSISNSEILGAVTTATGVTSAVINNITAGAGATAANVPSPGASADVYALLGQSLIASVSFT